MYSAVAGSVTFKAAAGFTWAAGTRYLLRLRCVGTAIKGRVWAAGSAEPLAWTIEITDSAVTGAGHAGFFAFANEADPICDYFAAATDGDAAALPGQETLRLGSAEWATPSTDVPASAPFDGRLTTVLEFGRSIVDSSRVGIGFQADEGQIAFANDDGAYDRYVDLYAVDGRPVTVRVGRKADPFSDHLVIFRGVALDWTAGDDVVTVRIRDRGFLLDVPAQPNLYAGTGGAEGGAELEGKRKPLCLGQVAAMEPTRVYSSIRLYQFSDGPIEGVIGVLDRGTVLTYQATVTDYAALVATAVTAGNYKQSQDGYFKLGSTPAGALFAGSAMLGDWPVYNTVDLIRQLFAHAADLAADDLDESSFDAVDVASAAEVNFHLAQDDASTVGEAVADLMAGIGGWAGFNRRGQLELGIFAAPAGDAVAAFDRTDIIELRRESLPEGVWPPPYRWRVAYHRNWETFNDWAASVPASIADLYTQPYLLSSASDDYLLANHPEAKDPPPVEAFFFLAADAETEAARLLALFSSGYRLYRLTLSRRGLLLGLGNVIDVTYPRWGFDAGKLGVVVAIDDRIELRDGSDVDQVEIVIFA